MSDDALALIMSLSLTFILLWMVFELIFLFIEGKFFSYYLLSKPKIKNQLYQCNNCERLFRRYQYLAHLSLHDKESCPHCDSSKSYYYYRNDRKLAFAKELASPSKWMDFHPDCPKISTQQYRAIKRAIKQSIAVDQQIESQIFFENYNKIKPDMNWIKSLNRKENQQSENR